MPSDFPDELIERLASARRVAVLTGAGISAESGIPTFRDPGGLWQQFKPEELANVQAFLENPVLVQGWYQHRLSVVNENAPNPGHHALVELEDLVPQFTLVTQNVDNLHQRAGSRNVIELHGNISRSYCIDCEREADEADLQPLSEGEPAICSDCGGYVRPDVVWFGELLPEGAMDAAGEAAAASDVFLSIGTSAVVYPAAGIPLLAKQEGSYLVEVNVEPSAISAYADVVLTGKSGEILPDLVSAVGRRRSGDGASGTEDQ